MVKLINLQGGVAYVADDREKEYLEAGYKKPASEPIVKDKPAKKETKTKK